MAYSILDMLRTLTNWSVFLEVQGLLGPGVVSSQNQGKGEQNSFGLAKVSLERPVDGLVCSQSMTMDLLF